MKWLVVLMAAFFAAASSAASEKQDASELESCSGSVLLEQVGKTMDQVEIPLPENVRVIEPNSAVTQDYRADRLNILLDESGAISGLRCG